MAKTKTRDPEKTRAHILNAAFMEIYRHGYNGVGVRDLAKKQTSLLARSFTIFQQRVMLLTRSSMKLFMRELWIDGLSHWLLIKNPLQGILKCFKNTFENWPDELVAWDVP